MKPFEDFHSGIGSQSMGVSIEKQRKAVVDDEIPMENLMGELRTNIMDNSRKITEANLVTPGNSGKLPLFPNYMIHLYTV